MKKIFKILVMIILVFSFTNAKAQEATLMPLIAGDTVVDGASVTKQFKATAGYSVVGVQFVLTKISGTVGGTTTPQVSMNGTNWFTLPGASAHTNTDVTTNTLGWATANGSPWVYYRINCTGTGTMSAQLRVYYILRRHN